MPMLSPRAKGLGEEFMKKSARKIAELGIWRKEMLLQIVALFVFAGVASGMVSQNFEDQSHPSLKLSVSLLIETLALWSAVPT